MYTWTSAGVSFVMYTLKQFLSDYPTDEACLEEIKNRKYSDWKCKCGRSKLYKVKNRPVYACACGVQVRPLTGTIFASTKVPLRYWFYVMYIMSQTKSGVSAAFIQRQLGCKYETAWRMMMKIRGLMKEDSKLKGNLEVDETYFRAKPWRTVRPLAYNGRAQTVVGIVERGGRARAFVIPTNSKHYLLKTIEDNTEAISSIYTDAFPAYKDLGLKYNHHTVVHSRGQYVDGHKYTNNIENVWSHVKRGIYGVYRVVHPEYLQFYLDEYLFRYSYRFCDDLFSLLLQRV